MGMQAKDVNAAVLNAISARAAVTRKGAISTDTKNRLESDMENRRS